jgi:hypothetical protein
VRYRAGFISKLHDSPPTADGLQERPFVLRLPAQGLKIASGSKWSFQIVVFGVAARYWPAVVATLSDVCLDKQRLEMVDLRILTGGGWLHVAQFRSSGGALQTLGACQSPFLPNTQPLRIQLVSPTFIRLDHKMVTSSATLEPLVVAGLASLSSVTLQRPRRDLAPGLRRLAASSQLRTIA